MTAVLKLSNENNIGYLRSNYQHRFHGYRRFLMAAANFASRKQPKFDFAGFEAYGLRNLPSTDVLRFRFSKVSIAESVPPVTDLRREVCGKRGSSITGDP
jgi:hypothetical protein